MSKKIISICLVFILSLALMVPVCFAADVPNWYNSIQPFGVAMYLEIPGVSLYNSDYVDSAVFNNPAYTTSRFSTGFVGSQGGWHTSFISSYDYYLNLIVYKDFITVSDFTFYPDYYRIGYDVHESFIPVDLVDVSFSHYDQTNFYGFSAVGRIPDGQYFASPIRDITVTGPSGSIPANVHVAVLIYQVPKDSQGVSADAEAVVSAINSQTQQLMSLIQGNGGDPEAGAVNSELSSAIDDVDRVEQDIHMQAEEAFKASDSLIQSFDPAAFQSAGNLYKQLSQSAFDSLGLISVFILIPLILFCVGAFIGKLK